MFHKECLKKKQYISGDGMLTSVWGPPMWHYIHTMSFNYPNNPTEFNKKYNKQHNTTGYKVQQYYIDFILNLKDTLPCGSCRINLVNNLKELDFNKNKHIITKNRLNFSKFIYELHNTVNIMLNKPKYKTYSYVRDKYESFRARCNNNTKVEKGCTELDVSSYKIKKSKCVLNIIPAEHKSESMKIHKDCSIIYARRNIDKNKTNKSRKSRKTNKSRKSKKQINQEK